MDSLTISAKNAYGIGYMEHTFSFLTKNSEHRRCMAIYAPNGTCKSSLRKSLKQWSMHLDPKDNFYDERESSFSLTTTPDDSLTPEGVFCFESMGTLEDSRFFDDGLLAAPELKAQYLSVIRKHAQQLEDLLTAIRNEYVAGRGAPDADGIKDLIVQEAECEDFNQAIALLLEQARSYPFPLCIEGKKINELLGRSPEVLDKPAIKEALTDFTVTRNKVLAESPYLTDLFDYPSAENLAAELEKIGFFAAGHSIVLRDKNTGIRREITTVNEFNVLLTAQLERASRDPNVQKQYQAVEKAFGKTKAAASLKSLACSDPDIAAAFSDFRKLKHAFLLKAILRCGPSIETYLESAEQYKQQMVAITDAVSQERTGWDCAIELFNARFSLPFAPYIANRVNSLIGSAEPIIAFRYDGREVPNDTLLRNLSEGERKALYMLQIIFEVERAKSKHGDKLLVFDDVVDSFDYANKYAFIEYLRDFATDDDIHVLLLTHNYDFYRTVTSRLGHQFSRANCLLAERDNDRVLRFDRVDYLKQNLLNVWKGRLSDNTIRIASIPMVRELVAIRAGNDSNEYTLLSSVLHGRADASTVTFDDLSSIYEAHWETKALTGDFRLVTDATLEECELIIEKGGFLKLQEKIVLSIGIRIIMERNIAETYRSHGKQIPEAMQFGTLARQFKQDFPDESSDLYDIIEKTCLIVPENIHVNSFMYEPLVDIGSSACVKLYRDVRAKLETGK